MQKHRNWSATFRKRILMTFDHVRAAFLYNSIQHPYRGLSIKSSIVHVRHQKREVVKSKNTIIIAGTKKRWRIDRGVLEGNRGIIVNLLFLENA